MSAKLKNIKLREISFVDKGASGDSEDRPRVAFWKRKNPISKEKRVKLTIEVAKKVSAAIQLKKDGMPEGAQAVLDTIKSTLSEEQWALVELMLAGQAPAPIEAAAPPEPKKEEPAAPAPDAPAEDPKKKEEELAMSKDELEKLQKRATDQDVELKKLRTDLEKAEKERADEIQKGRVAKFQKIAETELKNLQGKSEDLAKSLADLEDVLEPEAFKAHVQMLKAASDALGKSFKPVGAPGAESTGSAHAEVVAKVAELRKADPKLSESQAKARIMKDRANVELMKRYREERASN